MTNHPTHEEPSAFQRLHHFVHGLDKSAIFTFIGIVLLFSTSICVVLIAPRYVDPSWTEPSSSYQVQMYEIADPNFYISSATAGSPTLQYVQHIKNGYTLLAFHETDSVRIVAPEALETFITKLDESTLKLTSHLLLLRKPQKTADFDASATADKLRENLQSAWEKQNPKWNEEGKLKPDFEILELYAPESNEAFVIATTEGTVENWVDHNYKILDDAAMQTYPNASGFIYVNNPREYRYSRFGSGSEQGWRYDPDGEAVESLQQLKSHALGFRSRAELISLGEHIYAIEGCWYCHTDQTRTLIQDVVLNGSDSYPAPPSAANEYIYQRITFPGTRRIGPDISRTGIKRPSRDWHKGHFWSPKTASQGSIMPAFHHFFDSDPRGTARNPGGIGVPNYQFEAIYQYLMTKGTRITPPTQAWWRGRDPVMTKEIIEGHRRLP